MKIGTSTFSQPGILLNPGQQLVVNKDRQDRERDITFWEFTEFGVKIYLEYGSHIIDIWITYKMVRAHTLEERGER